MSNETRERDLVLAPNEFAFISDQTKGNQRICRSLQNKFSQYRQARCV